MNENEVLNHQLIKIFYLNQDLNWQHLLLLTTAETALLDTRVIGGDLAACSATKTDPGDRKTMPGHQGAAVVPDVKTSHEEIRPETHLLVRTECKEVSRLFTRRV